jgi:hypothetical protein
MTLVRYCIAAFMCFDLAGDGLLVRRAAPGFRSGDRSYLLPIQEPAGS